MSRLCVALLALYLNDITTKGGASSTRSLLGHLANQCQDTMEKKNKMQISEKEKEATAESFIIDGSSFPLQNVSGFCINRGLVSRI